MKYFILFKYTGKSAFIGVRSGADEISLMLRVAASHWVTAFEDYHVNSKRRVLVTKRSGVMFQNDEALNIV
jgi:hypothetical protein